MPPQPAPFVMFPTASNLFDKISTLIPEEWLPGSVDAVATASADGRRIVIKAVNYRRRAEYPARSASGRGVFLRRQSRRCTQSPQA